MAGDTPRNELGDVGSDSKSLFYKKNRKKSSATQPNINSLPNALEIAELQEGKKLFGSLLLRLKVEELLKNVSVDYTHVSDVEQMLRTIKSHLDTLKPRHIPHNAESLYPFMPLTSTPTSFAKYDYSFEFTRPTRCDVVGSYLLKTVMRTNSNIDVAMEMPAAMFRRKDYLNYRYFNKRALYVAETFLQLRELYPYTIEEEKENFDENDKGKKETVEETRKNQDKGNAQNSSQPSSSLRPYFFIQAVDGDVRRPIILIRFLKTSVSSTARDISLETCLNVPWTVRLFPVPPQNIFAVDHLGPDKNAVRFLSTSLCPEPLKCLYDAVNSGAKTSSKITSRLPPTPMYNGALLQDLTMRRWLQRLMCVLDKVDGFQQAVVLLKTWGYVNGHNCVWDSSTGVSESECVSDVDLSRPHSSSVPQEKVMSSISGFFFTVICSHVCLIEKESLSTATPLQIFRVTLMWFSSVDFKNFKVIYGRKDVVKLTENEKALALQLMVDEEGLLGIGPVYNILWNSQLFLSELQALAKQSANILNSMSDSFETIFKKNIFRVAPMLFWDFLLRLETLRNPELIVPECLIAETHEKQVQRVVRSEKDARGDQDARSDASCFTEFHMEHPPHYHIAGFVQRLLRRALGDRVCHVSGVCVRFLPPPWVCGASKPYDKTTGSHPIECPQFCWTDLHHLTSTKSVVVAPDVLIGVRCSLPVTTGETEATGITSTAWRTVDRGYPVESREARAFADFWGNVVTTRRFHDGSINKSIVWKPETNTFLYTGDVLSSNDSRLHEPYVCTIAMQIITHIVVRHLGHLFTITHTPWGGHEKTEERNKLFILDSRLQLQQKPVVNLVTAKSPTCVVHPAKSFAELKAQLLNLPDLPLLIKEIYCADQTGCLYGADLPHYIPRAHVSAPRHTAVNFIIDCVVEFQKTSGWPADPKGILWMKVALLVALRNSLLILCAFRDSLLEANGCKSEIGGVTDIRRSDIQGNDPNVNEPFLDIYWNTLNSTTVNENLPCVIFRTTIFHGPEHAAIATQLTSASSCIHTVWKSHRNIEAAVKSVRDMWWTPRCNTALTAASLEFPTFSAALRLVNVWAASQLFPFSSVRDLLCHLCLYIHRYAVHSEGPPTTAYTAFLQLLYVLTHHDWESSGIFLQYHAHSNPLTRELQEALKAARQRCIDGINACKVATQDSSCDEPSDAGTQYNSTAPRCPVVWIASPDDPHCQLIQLPNSTTTLHMIEVARDTLAIAQRLWCGGTIDAIAAQTVNYMQNRQFYFWSTPMLRHLCKTTWRHLFNPRIAQRFDIIIHLQYDSLGIQKKHMPAIPPPCKEVGSRKRQFKNLESASTTLVTRTSQESTYFPKYICIDQPSDALANVVHCFKSSVQEAFDQDAGMSRLSAGALVDHTLSTAEQPSTCSTPPIEGKHQTTLVLRSAFKCYVKALESFLGPLADVYYDDLALPYPTAIFLKFNPSALAVEPMTLALTSSCPNTLLRDMRLSVHDSPAGNTKAALQVPNIPLLFSLLMSLGPHFVRHIELL